MTIKKQHGPIFTRLSLATHNPLAPGLEPNAMRRPPVGVGPSVNRITHHTEDAFVNRQLPHDVSALWTVRGAWQSNSLLPQPAVNLTSTLELGEFLENQLDCLLHTLIWLFFDAVLMRNLTVAYRDGAKQLTAFC